MFNMHICVSWMECRLSPALCAMSSLSGYMPPSQASRCQVGPLYVPDPVFAVVATPLKNYIIAIFPVADFLALLHGYRPRDPGAADDGGARRAARWPRG